uniref:Prephenate dehydrogenase/arogenate dehydrogenase family protein n=1 Tax=Candidatus Methanomethylicus mesodigestus TaxID=1867258 RepID=A0A7C3F4Y0_9CREN
MGRCLAFLLGKHCDLTICSRDLRKAKALARKAGAKAADYGGCKKKDIVFLAVPTQDLTEVASKVSNLMPAGALLVDLSSVKCGIVEVIERSLPERLYYISAHPLFTSHRVRRKNAMLVPVRAGQWMERLRQLLVVAGMEVKEVGAEEHDIIMAAIQVTHHFSLLSLREALREAGFRDLKELEPFMTHSMAKTIGALRLIESNMETIDMIQEKNKFAQYARQRFIEQAERLDERYRHSSALN